MRAFIAVRIHESERYRKELWTSSLRAAEIVLFVTGRGSVIASPIAPLIKITGKTKTFNKMREMTSISMQAQYSKGQTRLTKQLSHSPD